MQRRSRRAAAGQQEPSQRRQGLIERIDPALQRVDACLIDGGLGHAGRHLRLGVGEMRTDGEQVALDGLEHLLRGLVDSGG